MRLRSGDLNYGKAPNHRGSGISSPFLPRHRTYRRGRGCVTGVHPRGVSPEDSLLIANRIGPFDRALNTASPLRSRNTIRRVAQDASLVKTHRRKVTRHRINVSRKLEPLRVRLNGNLPDSSPARTQNMPVIKLLARRMDYPYLKLPSGLIRGVDITGDIPPKNALTRRYSQPSTNARRIKQGLRARNSRILRSISKTQDAAMTHKCLGTFADRVPQEMAIGADDSDSLRP